MQFLGGVGVSQIIPEGGVRDKEWINVFLLKVNTEDLNLNLQEEEVQGTRWIPLDELVADIDDDERYKEYLNHPKSYYRKTTAKIKEVVG